MFTYLPDIGIDLVPETDTFSESSNKDSGTSESSSKIENQTTAPEQTQIELNESPKENNSTTTTISNSQESSATVEYSINSSSQDESNYSSSSTANNSSEKNIDPWEGAKFLMSFFTSPFNKSSSSEEQSSITNEDPTELPIEGNFNEGNHFKHQKNVGSANEIVKALFDTVKGAATISVEECEQHKFQCKEREKLNDKTGGTENTEMVGVNVYLDKQEKPLLPGARKVLKKHAEAKQKAKEDSQSDISSPSEAVSHAMNEFKIAQEFKKGEDIYDKAGGVIHTLKGIAEIVALDMEQISGGVTSQPGFVVTRVSASFFKKEQADTVIEKNKSIYLTRFKSQVLEIENYH